MAVNFRCDACGTTVLGIYRDGKWRQPEGWFINDSPGWHPPHYVCSRDCISAMARGYMEEAGPDVYIWTKDDHVDPADVANLKQPGHWDAVMDGLTAASSEGRL